MGTAVDPRRDPARRDLVVLVARVVGLPEAVGGPAVGGPAAVASVASAADAASAVGQLPRAARHDPTGAWRRARPAP